MLDLLAPQQISGAQTFRVVLVVALKQRFSDIRLLHRLVCRSLDRIALPCLVARVTAFDILVARVAPNAIREVALGDRLAGRFIRLDVLFIIPVVLGHSCFQH